MAINTAVKAKQELSPAPSTKHATLKVHRCPYLDEYIGTADQLIEAGILQAGQFPGDPGRGKTMVSYTADGQAAARGSCKGAGYRQVRRVSRTMFNVTVRVDEAETKRRHDEDREQRENAKLSADARTELQREMGRLKELPATPQEYAKDAADLFWIGVNTFFRAHCGKVPHESGYRFSASDAEKFAELARTLYWAIREDGTPKFDPAFRLRNVTKARANAAKTDLPLQRMLRSLTSAK